MAIDLKPWLLHIQPPPCPHLCFESCFKNCSPASVTSSCPLEESRLSLALLVLQGSTTFYYLSFSKGKMPFYVLTTNCRVSCIWEKELKESMIYKTFLLWGGQVGIESRAYVHVPLSHILSSRPWAKYSFLRSTELRISGDLWKTAVHATQNL